MAMTQCAQNEDSLFPGLPRCEAIQSQKESTVISELLFISVVLSLDLPLGMPFSKESDSHS